MASPKALKLRDEETTGAVVIPFPAMPRRDAEIAAAIPLSVVPRRDAPASKAAPKSANENERPAVPHVARGAQWWQIGIVISIGLHLGAAAIFQSKYSYDLERAAGAAAAASAEGTAVIPIEVVVTAALPSAPTPTDATAPDAIKAAQTTPKESSDDKKRQSSPPQKSDEAAEVVPVAKETPQPSKEKQEHKERSQQSRSAAANPSPAAASRAEGRAGAGGHAETGGTANISSYQSQVLAHLQRYRIYPPEARSRGITGMAMVRFALASNGGVISASLGRGSGASILDDAALSMVRRASPFPPFPAGLGRSRMDFAAPIRFDLR